MKPTSSLFWCRFKYSAKQQSVWCTLHRGYHLVHTTSVHHLLGTKNLVFRMLDTPGALFIPPDSVWGKKSYSRLDYG